MNKVIFMGRLTKDPEIRHTGTTDIAGFTIAVDRRWKKDGEQEADFFNCTAFGKTAEFAEKYLAKGTKIACVCRAQNNNYTDKNGNRVYGIQFIVEEIEFAESKRKQEEPAAAPDDFVNIPEGVDDSELPFI